MSVHITPAFLKRSREQRLLTELVEELACDVIGANYTDPSLAEIDAVEDDLREQLERSLLAAELPEQESREDAALHYRADLDYERSAGL